MRKLFLLLLLTTNVGYAQVSTYKPSTFKGVVFQPIEQDDYTNQIMERNMERNERRRNEAYTQYSKLLTILGEYGSKLNNDNATLLWFKQYKDEITEEFEAYSELESWAEALDYVILKQGEVANDPELLARIRTSKEYKENLKSILERKDMSQDQKNEWIQKNPYCFIPIEDNNGKVIGGKLGTTADIDAYKAEKEKKKRIKEEEERKRETYRLYSMTHPFDNYDYSRYDKVIDHPNYEYYPFRPSQCNEITITKVALSSTQTRIELEWYNTNYNYCYVNRGTYIKASNTKKLNLLWAHNISIYPSFTSFKKYGERLKFALVFPPLPPNTKSFTLADSNKKGWKFRKIKLY